MLTDIKVIVLPDHPCYDSMHPVPEFTHRRMLLPWANIVVNEGLFDRVLQNVEVVPLEFTLIIDRVLATRTIIRKFKPGVGENFLPQFITLFL